ncbi:MAG: MerR family transcriptional regulator [Bacteroidota bacterium]
MKIGEIAKLSGFSKDTLRYYEKIGLISTNKKLRTENNYRVYDDHILKQLNQIKTLKASGFTLNEIKDLMALNEVDLVTCLHVTTLVDEKLVKLTQQISRLTQIKENLIKLKTTCTGKCLETLQEI